MAFLGLALGAGKALLGLATKKKPKSPAPTYGLGPLGGQQPDSTKYTETKSAMGMTSTKSMTIYGPGQKDARGRTCHPNKSTYVTRGGGTSHWPQQLIVHPAGSECVPSRRINAGNGKAAKRAVRRLVAFYRLSNQVAKQLRRAASKAGVGRHRGGQKVIRGGGGVQVIDTG
jgi:hypothetical protein